MWESIGSYYLQCLVNKQKKQQQTNRCVSFIGCPQVSIEALLHDADHGSGPCMLL